MVTGDKKPIRWGIWGTGHIAGKFASDLRAVPDAILHSICSRSQDSASAFAAHHGAQSSTDNAETFLADPELDAIYVATPHVLHLEQAEMAMSHGKAVLIEKPVGMSAVEARAMDAASEKHGVLAMEALWTRFLPCTVKARDMIHDEALGKPLRAEASLHFYRPFDPEHRLFKPELGGGAALDLGVYPISIAHFLLGELELTSAAWSAAPTGVDQSTRFEMLAGGVPVKASVGFWGRKDQVGDNGFIVYCEGGALRLNRPFVASPALAIWKKPQEQIVKIEGNKLQRAIGKLRNRPHEIIWDQRQTTGLNAQVEAFQTALRAGQRQVPENTLQTSADVLTVIEAILDQPASAGPLR